MMEEVRPKYATDRKIDHSTPFVQLLASLEAVVAASEHKEASADVQQVQYVLKA